MIKLHRIVETMVCLLMTIVIDTWVAETLTKERHLPFDFFFLTRQLWRVKFSIFLEGHFLGINYLFLFCFFFLVFDNHILLIALILKKFV